MSAWGPRAKPHAEWPPVRPTNTARKCVEESLGTALGWLLVACLLAGAVLWWIA